VITSRIKRIVTEKDSPSTPVQFASVQVLPQGAVTITNAQESSLSKVKAGKVNIRLQFLGMESLDTTLVLSAGKAEEITFRRKPPHSAGEVSVVAQESQAGQATASKISRQAMDHLQATSVSDLLQLMREARLQIQFKYSSDFYHPEPCGEASAMNALGTTVYVDGSPLSNNSNLQTFPRPYQVQGLRLQRSFSKFRDRPQDTVDRQHRIGRSDPRNSFC
jgi:hypothetical protein